MAVAGISFIALLSLVLPAVIVLIVVLSIVKSKRAKAKNDAPMLTVSATVVSKRYDYKNGGVFYAVIFDVEGQGTLELFLPPDRFEAINEGDRGYLAYRGDKFFAFS